jgi:hypothetical protein
MLKFASSKPKSILYPAFEPTAEHDSAEPRSCASDGKSEEMGLYCIHNQRADLHYLLMQQGRSATNSRTTS